MWRPDRKVPQTQQIFDQGQVYSLKLLSAEYQAELSGNQLLLPTSQQPSAPVTANQQSLLLLMHSWENEILISKQGRISVP